MAGSPARHEPTVPIGSYVSGRYDTGHSVSATVGAVLVYNRVRHQARGNPRRTGQRHATGREFGEPLSPAGHLVSAEPIEAAGLLVIPRHGPSAAPPRQPTMSTQKACFRRPRPGSWTACARRRPGGRLQPSASGTPPSTVGLAARSVPCCVEVQVTCCRGGLMWSSRCVRGGVRAGCWGVRSRLSWRWFPGTGRWCAAGGRRVRF